MQARELVKLYYRIGEVSKIVGVQPHVLRYWETEFRSIRPQKSGKGQRVYSRRDVEKLLEVKDLLRNQGFTIAGARKRLVAGPSAKGAKPEGKPLREEAPVDENQSVGALDVVGRLRKTQPEPASDAIPAKRTLPVPESRDRHWAVPAPQPSTKPLPLSHMATFGSRVEYGECVAPKMSVLQLEPSSLGASRTADRSARSMRRTLLGLRAEMLRVLDELNSEGELPETISTV